MTTSGERARFLIWAGAFLVALTRMRACQSPSDERLSSSHDTPRILPLASEDGANAQTLFVCATRVRETIKWPRL